MAIDLGTQTDVTASTQERTCNLSISCPVGVVPVISLYRQNAITINGTVSIQSQFGYQFSMDAAHTSVACDVPSDVAQQLGLTQTHFTIGQIMALVSAGCDALAIFEKSLRAQV